MVAVPYFRPFHPQSGPERFQESDEKFDIILTVEEKVYDQVPCRPQGSFIHLSTDSGALRGAGVG
jgi:hypothetical protein